jgi:hypothetical protein
MLIMSALKNPNSSPHSSQLYGSPHPLYGSGGGLEFCYSILNLLDKWKK